MSRVEMLKGLFSDSYSLFEGIVADLTLNELTRTYPDAKVDSIAAIFAHTATAEDWMVQELIKATPHLFVQGEWVGKVGSAPVDGFLPKEWVATLTEDQWAAMKAYAAEVRAATEDTLNTISEAELDRSLTLYGQERTVGYVLANYALFHLVEHAGEMAALKGMLGKQGLPY